MKKLVCLLVLMVVMVCIIEMRKDREELPVEPSEAPITETQPTALPTPSPEPSPSPTVETQGFRIEGYTAEQVADFFCEVALENEYNHGVSDGKALQKWQQPIYYLVYGDPTAEDTALIASFADELNRIEGFPGMYVAPSVGQENFVFSFLDRRQMNADAGYVVNGEYADGITLWDYYTNTNEIYHTRIWICSELSQNLRNSVILEEIVNSLGLGNDSRLRSDSIIYQYYSEPQELTEMDWLLLKILYSEDIKCGMKAEQCREAINKLYQ